nr:hypothetical protein [Pseudomonas aeruginosa]
MARQPGRYAIQRRGIVEP